MKYYVEDLLRPPVELAAAYPYLAAAATFAVAPYIAPVVGESMLMLSVACFIRGAWRLRQGNRIRRYQRRLRRLPPLERDYTAINALRNHHYLGHGFRWSARHTGRMINLDKPDYLHHTLPGRREHWRQWLLLRDSATVNALLACRLGRALLPPPPPGGGRAALHGVGLWEGETPVIEEIGAGGQHTLIYGRTRSGKSNYLKLLVGQDIRRNDGPVIIINPKGGRELLVSVYEHAKAAGRLDDLIIFSLAAPEISARWNATGRFAKITEIATRTADKMPNSGTAMAFTAFVWRYVFVITRVLGFLGEPMDYRAIKRYAENFEPLAVAALRRATERTVESRRLQSLTDYFAADPRNRPLIDAAPSVPRAILDRAPDLAALYTAYRESGTQVEIIDSVCKILEHERAHFDKLVASLLPFLEKVCADPIGGLVAPGPDDPRPSFAWDTVIEQDKIVYVDLDALTDPEIAQVVGNLMFSDLTSLAGVLYRDNKTNKRVIIHADEFNELMGREFIPLLNKAGGAGYIVFAYTQTLPDLVVRVGEESRAQQAIGNFARVISFGLRDEKTAKSLISWLQKVRVDHLLLGSGAGGAGDLDKDRVFSATNIQRRQQEFVEALQPSDLAQLMIGHAFVYSEGTVTKIRVPKPRPSALDLPADIAQVADRLGQPQAGADWYIYRPSIDFDRVAA